MIDQQGQEVIGHGYERYTNYLVTLGCLHPDVQPDRADTGV